jgi:hypothetical protein
MISKKVKVKRQKYKKGDEISKLVFPSSLLPFTFFLLPFLHFSQKHQYAYDYEGHSGDVVY